MVETAICLHDPTEKLVQGELVEDARRLVLARASGALLLPADPDLIRQGGVRGFFWRNWGLSATWNKMMSQPGCLMLIYAVPGRERLYWAAEIEAVEPSAPIEGTLRLGLDTTQLGTALAGLGATSTPIQLSKVELSKPDRRAIIKSSVHLALSKEGYLAMALFAVAKNLRVRWSAVTQSQQVVDAW